MSNSNEVKVEGNKVEPPWTNPGSNNNEYKENDPVGLVELKIFTLLITKGADLSCSDYDGNSFFGNKQKMQYQNI